jgi:hypothetical protein
MRRTSLPSYRPSRAGDLIGHTRAGRPILLPGGGSPDHEGDTTPPEGDTTPPADPETPYAFPFAVPGDFTASTDDDLTGLLDQVREHAREHAALPPAEITAGTLAALRACRDLANDITAEQTARAARVAEAGDLSAELEGVFAAAPVPATQPEPRPERQPEPAPQPEPAAVVAAAPRRAAPSVRQVARRAPAAPPVPEATARPYAVMTAAADVPNFASGQQLGSFDEAARALSARLDQYPAMSAGRARAEGNRRPVTVYDGPEGRHLPLKQFTRHNAVQFRREFPDELRVVDEARAYAVAEYAATERRLPGGSLRESARLALKAGGSLVAAQGWCAPSEVIYDLCELESRDGILDLPEIQASRGGFQVPTGGGPNFATIWSGIGSSGDTHLTEAEVIADTAKVCWEIPCPEFEDIRLGVDYVCLTGGLLQRRGYPEVVARFSRGAMVALDHKINAGVIDVIIAEAGAAVALSADPSGDDAISALLSGVELGIVDMKYRHRMAFNTTLEVVLPMWVLAVLRAAGTRRAGGNIDMINITDAQIMDWFTTRGAVPRFVYDWQDSFDGLAGGPGAATALEALPATVEFLVYPAGTFVKAVQDVVALDTIYDSTLLTANQYTAIFAEDGWAVLQLCPAVRRYSAPVDVSGVVGCCAGEVS